jgi:hypothetical protein
MAIGIWFIGGGVVIVLLAIAWFLFFATGHMDRRVK